MRSHEHLLSIALILFSHGTQAALKFSKCCLVIFRSAKKKKKALIFCWNTVLCLLIHEWARNFK
ncbi:unnamed protein product [Nyctereutes procyonoides]|uniref:(raccoon dog) hypothetical protein n=1 Tax=Nyctereutes procyonoides TaxID=34880 RepID=A0A811ZTB4_NYCPR|nr:unnamed protein product [Nyctereutes procyonoides]